MLYFLARRQAVVDGEMFVLRYRHAERLQGGVERLVMPFARVDQDPVHVEQHRCDFLTHRKSPSPPAVDRCTASAGRSEEHTSELQSLMRISYAVFCLKKKKQINTHNT